MNSREIPPKLVAKKLVSKATSAICFNFTGHITRTPTKGCIKICTAFGQDFYVDGSGVNDHRTSDGFMPAWMVPEFSPVPAKKQRRAEATARVAPTSPSMMPHKIEFEFNYVWSSFFKASDHKVLVSHYCLVVNPDYVTSGVELMDAVLTRPAIPDMVVVEKVLLSIISINIAMTIIIIMSLPLSSLLSLNTIIIIIIIMIFINGIMIIVITSTIIIIIYSHYHYRHPYHYH